MALLLIAVMAVGILAACGGGEPAADTAAAESSDDDKEMAAADDGVSSNQAPELLEMVRNGDLPLPAERLPVNPAIVGPVDGIGQ